jgi:hypothetical protein
MERGAGDPPFSRTFPKMARARPPAKVAEEEWVICVDCLLTQRFERSLPHCRKGRKEPSEATHDKRHEHADGQ